VNQPRRLLDDSSADPDLARLVRAARPPRPLEAAAFERSRKRVAMFGSIPAGLGVLVWIKHAALGAVLGAGVVAAVSAPRWLTPETSTAPATSVAPRATNVAPRKNQRAPEIPTAEVPEEKSPEVERPVAPELPAAPSLASAPAPSADGGLSREVSLLEAARSELDRRPGSALSLLSRHEREFPSGALSLEREFLVVSALVRLGRRGEAEARASSLRARSPGSLYEKRLEALLGDGSAP
jgi:hypothetical protein